MNWSLTGGGQRTRKELRNILLYFYPRDSTPGCTQEGLDFAANYKKLQKLGVEVLGVSGCSLASHEKFKAKHNFPFELLSDPEHALCEEFGVMKMKSMYGKKFRGIERSTFLLNAQGKIIQEWRGVKVKDHVQEVLAFLKK